MADRACVVCGQSFVPQPRRAPPPVTCSEACRAERLRQTHQAAARRHRGTPVIPDRKCVICEVEFAPQRRTDKTCSLDCQIQWRRQLTRERAARHYKPRAPRPDTICESCKARIPAPRMGPMPRWCQPCRAAKRDERTRKRVAVRRCYKCQKPMPEAKRQPGTAVCDDCRTDPRKHRQAHEQRRRLRKYGLTQDDYDQLLLKQCGRCAGCGTDDPGVKGWSIDHHHGSGRVRALLCMRCNTMLGLANEDPAMLRALADFIERERDKDIV